MHACCASLRPTRLSLKSLQDGCVSQGSDGDHGLHLRLHTSFLWRLGYCLPCDRVWQACKCKVCASQQALVLIFMIIESRGPDSNVQPAGYLAIGTCILQVNWKVTEIVSQAPHYLQRGGCGL